MAARTARSSSLTALCGSARLCRTSAFLGSPNFKSHGAEERNAGCTAQPSGEVWRHKAVCLLVTSRRQRTEANTCCTFPMSPPEPRIRGLTVACARSCQTGGEIQDGAADCDRRSLPTEWHSSRGPRPPADPLPAQIVSAKWTGH